MFQTIQNCQLHGCSRAASTFCFCCNKNVCTRHFTEHIEAAKAQIDPLTNEINTMVEKIQGLRIEQITGTSFAELHQWKSDMYQLVDEIFLAKSKEMEDLIETNKNKFVEHKKQQLETMMKIQDDVKQLVEDGDATFQQIHLLKNQLASVETNLTSFKKDFLSVNARVFGQGLITVSSSLKKPPPSQILQSNPTAVRDAHSARKLRRAQANLGAPTTASVSPNLATPPQPRQFFFFNEFDSRLQKNPTTHSSPTVTSTFGLAPTNTTNTFGTSSTFSPIGSANNTSPLATSTAPTSTTNIFGTSSSFSPIGSSNNTSPLAASTASTSTTNIFGTSLAFSPIGSTNNTSPLATSTASTSTTNIFGTSSSLSPIGSANNTSPLATSTAPTSTTNIFGTSSSLSPIGSANNTSPLATSTASTSTTNIFGASLAVSPSGSGNKSLFATSAAPKFNFTGNK